MGWMDMVSIPRWMERAPGYQAGDHLVRLADDPDLPDPVEAERQRVERQKLREGQAAQAAERDLLAARDDRNQQLHREGDWVAPGEVLTRFPRVAEKLAQGMPSPRMMSFGPLDEKAKTAQWQRDMERARQAALNEDGVVAPSLAWGHERHEVPR